MEENKEQQNGENIKVIRTYTSDMAEVIRNNEISAIKIAMAEKEKRDQGLLYRKSEGMDRSKLLLIIGGIILIIVAVIISLSVIQKKDSTKITPPEVIDNTKTFISYDSSLDIDVTNMTNVNELSDVIKKVVVDSTLTKVFFLKKEIDKISYKLTSGEFISLIGETMPSALIRSLSDNYILGKYGNISIPDEKNSTFIIFETMNYDQAYASMLKWEKTMLKDLYVLFEIKINNNTIFEKQWKDVLINNKDARVLYDENGEEVLCYLFVNNNDFIIANNIDTLEKILQKVMAKSN